VSSHDKIAIPFFNAGRSNARLDDWTVRGEQLLPTIHRQLGALIIIVYSHVCLCLTLFATRVEFTPPACARVAVRGAFARRIEAQHSHKKTDGTPESVMYNALNDYGVGSHRICTSMGRGVELTRPSLDYSLNLLAKRRGML
jgi:hypothetical protein